MCELAEVWAATVNHSSKVAFAATKMQKVPSASTCKHSGLAMMLAFHFKALIQAFKIVFVEVFTSNPQTTLNGVLVFFTHNSFIIRLLFVLSPA